MHSKSRRENPCPVWVYKVGFSSKEESNVEPLPQRWNHNVGADLGLRFPNKVQAKYISICVVNLISHGSILNKLFAPIYPLISPFSSFPSAPQPLQPNSMHIGRTHKLKISRLRRTHVVPPSIFISTLRSKLLSILEQSLTAKGRHS
jgi:hypothetical protein